MKPKIFLLFTVFAITSYGYDYVEADRLYRTDGSQGDVAAAIAKAAAGDTVFIPPGRFTWGANGGWIKIEKNITLRGAGASATTIAIADTAGTYTNAVIRFVGAGTVRSLSIESASSESDNRTPISAAGAGGWRVTDIVYRQQEGHSSYFMYVNGAHGLVDNCVISGGAGTSELFFVRGKADSWTTPSSLGSVDAVYIEDCSFFGQGYVCDANDRARMVVRFCTINANMKVDAHGFASNSERGARHVEIYGNKWTVDSPRAAQIEIRGGTGMVFSNSTANVAGRLYLTDYGYLGLWSSFGKVYQTPDEYPLNDQIGVGQDPKTAASEPMYLWLNRNPNGLWPRQLKLPASGAVEEYGESFTEEEIVMADRDFFMEVKNFDGSSGVGVGTAAEMAKLIPKKRGVGFWVTDEADWNKQQEGPDGRLYVWNGEEWVMKYTPFVYPHPARGILSPMPAAPGNLRVGD